jgi:hypothetical protein
MQVLWYKGIAPDRLDFFTFAKLPCSHPLRCELYHFLM